MEDEKKTKKQLIEELNELRQCVAELKSFEKEIEQTRKFTKAFMQNSIPVAIMTSKEGRFVDVSDAFLRFTGRQRDEVIGRTSIECGIITAEQRGVFYDELNKKGRVEDLEMEVRTKDGALRYGLFNAVMMSLNNEKYVLTVSLDITSRKQAEALLKKTEQELSLIFDTAPLLIWQKDREGRYLQVNRTYCDTVGISKDTIVGKTDYDLFPKEIADQYVSHDRKVLDSRMSEFGIEEHHQKSSGEHGWSRTDKLIYYDVDGKITGTIGFATDITKHKRAEDALRGSEEKYRRIVETANEGILAIDGERITTFVNPQMAKMLGYALEEMIGKHITFFMFPEDLPAYEARMEERVKGVGGQYEQKFRHKDGHSVWCFVSAQARMDEKGAFLGFFAMLTNITERRQTEMFLQDIIVKNPMSIQIVDKEGYTIQVNAAHTELFGAVPHADFSIFNDPQIQEQGLDKFFERAKKGEVVHLPDAYFNIHNFNSDYPDTPVWLRALIFPLYDSVGKPERFVLMHEDITSRKQAEAALRLSEDNFRRSLDESPLGVRIVNTEGETIYANRAILDINGCDTLEELKTTPVEMRYTPESFADHQIRKEKRKRGDDAPSEYEIRIIRKDGEIHHLQAFRKEILWDGEKQFQVLYNDITERKQATEILRESEVRYRELFENMRSGVAVYETHNNGEDFIFKEYNAAGEMLDKTPRGQAIGRSVVDVFPGVKDFGLFDVFRRVYRTGKPERHPVTFYKDEKISGWRESYVYKLPSGEIVAVYEDITERKQAEEALRQSEERFRAIASNTPDHILIQDNQLRYLHVVNPQLGLTEQDMIGKTDYDFLSKEDADKLTEIKRQVLKTGSPAHVEVPLTSSKGEQQFFDGSYIPKFDAKGRVDGLIGYFRNATERKRVEEAIRTAEKTYRNVFLSSQIGLFRTDINTGQLLDANDAVARFIGYQDRISLLAEPFNISERYADPYDREKMISLLQAHGEFQNFEARFRKNDGSIILMRFSAKLVREKGWVEGVSEDITDRKQAEERIHASLREKDILLNEIHHRVKNNMQVISSLLKLQASASGSPELTERLNESQSRIHAMALVHEKLYDSKDFARIDLAGYVRTLSQELFQSHKINQWKIALIVQTDGDVYVDVNKAIPCGLILNELISNAFKHAFPGGRQGKLQIILRETENKEIEIVVRDNGMGLPDDVDIHAPRSLGLDLVNGLVKNQLDGQIEVKRDKGTEFRIKFPL
jgi:PAS domain S-box-containing protein